MRHSQSATPVLAYTPLKLLIVYLTFTLLIALFGPTIYFNFPVQNVVIFMFLVMAVMTFGFINGVRMPLKGPKSGVKSGGVSVKKIFRVSLAIALLVLVFLTFNAYLSNNLNTDITEMGSTYLDSYSGYERNSGTYDADFLIYSFSLPFNFIATIWGLYYFSSLTRLEKNLVILLLIWTIVYYVLGSGKQKQLADTAIYIISIMAVKKGVNNKSISISSIISSIIAGLMLTMAFMFILSQRYAALAVDLFNYNQKSANNITINIDHPVFAIFGPDMGLTMSIFLSYLSQGYYGLGLATTVNHSWTYFLGFSYSLSVIANRILGVEWVWPDTLVYQAGVQRDWGENRWHTVFTHFASDFTFPGTILLFGFFAYLYARVWMSAIRYQNPYAILMFSLLTLGAFFIPANNQLLHTPGGLITVVIVSILYLKNARAYNERSS